LEKANSLNLSWSKPCKNALPLLSSFTIFEPIKVKRDLYAAAGVAEYWVVDLNKQKIHVYWGSQEGNYQNSKVYKKGETLYAQHLDLTLEMDWLWTW
jgi:Uma2 family endonuclease